MPAAGADFFLWAPRRRWVGRFWGRSCWCVYPPLRPQPNNQMSPRLSVHLRPQGEISASWWWSTTWPSLAVAAPTGPRHHEDATVSVKRPMPTELANASAILVIVSRRQCTRSASQAPSPLGVAARRHPRTAPPRALMAHHFPAGNGRQPLPAGAGWRI